MASSLKLPRRGAADYPAGRKNNIIRSLLAGTRPTKVLFRELYATGETLLVAGSPLYLAPVFFATGTPSFSDEVPRNADLPLGLGAIRHPQH